MIVREEKKELKDENQRERERELKNNNQKRERKKYTNKKKERERLRDVTFDFLKLKARIIFVKTTFLKSPNIFRFAQPIVNC